MKHSLSLSHTHTHNHTHKYRKHDAYYFINRMILKYTSMLRMACCLNPKADLTTLCLDHYRTVAYHKIHNYESALKHQAPGVTWNTVLAGGTLTSDSVLTGVHLHLTLCWLGYTYIWLCCLGYTYIRLSWLGVHLHQTVLAGVTLTSDSVLTGGYTYIRQCWMGGILTSDSVMTGGYTYIRLCWLGVHLIRLCVDWGVYLHQTLFACVGERVLPHGASLGVVVGWVQVQIVQILQKHPKGYQSGLAWFFFSLSGMHNNWTTHPSGAKMPGLPPTQTWRRSCGALLTPMQPWDQNHLSGFHYCKTKHCKMRLSACQLIYCTKLTYK